MTDRPARVCWVVTDGRRGIENQALGLAEAAARLNPLTIRVKIAPREASAPRVIASRLRGARLSDLQDAGSNGISRSEVSTDEAPDLWIGCGRISLRYAPLAREAFGRRVFITQVQDPGGGLERFDLVVPPLHDGVEGPNVLSILGSPNRIDLSRLAQAPAAALPPPPRAAFLIGGGSKRHELSAETEDAVLAAIASARAESWSVLATTSRRTPRDVADRLREALDGDDRARIWTSEADGENPYTLFLAAADVVVATRDSTNMITEAASAGRPVYLLAMAGEDGKLGALYAELARRGCVREYAGRLETWKVEPLRETERAAAEMMRRAEAVWSALE